MSRISRKPIILNNMVTFKVEKNNFIIVTCNNNKLTKQIHNSVLIKADKNIILISPIDNSKKSNMHAGTARSIINNMVLGIQIPFKKTLKLVGVGYKVQKNNNMLTLNVGFSHIINYQIPDGISINLPSSTEIILKGSDKCLLGQAAANIRNYRIPEVYKGKGIRYINEKIIIKEAKKK